MSRFKLAGRRPAGPDARAGADWPSLELDSLTRTDRLPDLPPWFLDQLAMPDEPAAATTNRFPVADLRRPKRAK